MTLFNYRLFWTAMLTSEISSVQILVFASFCESASSLGITRRRTKRPVRHSTATAGRRRKLVPCLFHLCYNQNADSSESGLFLVLETGKRSADETASSLGASGVRW
jgi:hypothetical protein